MVSTAVLYALATNDRLFNLTRRYVTIRIQVLTIIDCACVRGTSGISSFCSAICVCESECVCVYSVATALHSLHMSRAVGVAHGCPRPRRAGQHNNRTSASLRYQVCTPDAPHACESAHTSRHTNDAATSFKHSAHERTR